MEELLQVLPEGVPSKGRVFCPTLNITQVLKVQATGKKMCINVRLKTWFFQTKIRAELASSNKQRKAVWVCYRGQLV